MNQRIRLRDHIQGALFVMAIALMLVTMLIVTAIPNIGIAVGRKIVRGHSYTKGISV